MIHDAVNIDDMIGVALAVEYPSDLDLCPLDQMLQDFALHLNVPHDASLLQVLVQDDALKSHLIFIISLLGVVVALVTSNEVKQNETQVVTQVVMLLVSDDLMVAWELHFILLYKLGKVAD